MPTPQKTNPDPIHLRPATTADIPTLATLAATAFRGSPLDLQFFPNHIRDPDGHRRWFVHEFCVRLAQVELGRQVALVAEVGGGKRVGEDEGRRGGGDGDVREVVENVGLKRRMKRDTNSHDVKNGFGSPLSEIEKEPSAPASSPSKSTTQKREIAGFACFVYSQPPQSSPSSPLPPPSFLTHLITALTLLRLQLSLFVSLLLNPSLFSSRTMRSFAQQSQSILSSTSTTTDTTTTTTTGVTSTTTPLSSPSPPPPPSPNPTLTLTTLATSPTHQSRGIGRALVNWGVARAEEEGLDMVLESAIPLSRWYAKNWGFESVGEIVLPEKEVRVVGVDGAWKGGWWWFGKREVVMVVVGEVKMVVMVRKGGKMGGRVME